MKKLFFLLLLFTHLSFAETVKIISNKNPSYRSIISYQICALNRQNEPKDCYPMEIALIDKNQQSIEIPIDNWAFYVNVIHIIEENEKGEIKAKGFFPWEAFCNGYYNHAVVLNEDGGSHIICKTEMPNFNRTFNRT